MTHHRTASVWVASICLEDMHNVVQLQVIGLDPLLVLGLDSSPLAVQVETSRAGLLALRLRGYSRVVAGVLPAVSCSWHMPLASASLPSV